jgi:hypothetical protein
VGREVDAQQAQVPLCWPTEALISLVGMAVVRTLESGGGPDELLAACPGKDEWDSAAMQGLPFTTSGDETVPDLSFQGSLFAIQGPEPRMSAASRALCSRMPWVAQALGTIVSPQGKPAWYFATRSLLAWTQFAALFDGRWSHWEWTETPVDATDETLPGFTQAQPPPQHRM